MRKRTLLLLLVLSIATAVAAAVGCSGHSSGGNGGTSPPPTSPVGTPTGCDTQWRIDDPLYAAAQEVSLVPGGAATMSNGTLVLTFNGTLPVATNGGIASAVLYSKRVFTGNFDAKVRVSFAATGTSMGAFFTVADVDGGLWMVVDEQASGPEWIGPGPTQNRYPSFPISAMRMGRIGNTMYFGHDTAGTLTSLGSYGPELGDRAIGFGIANVSDPPNPVTGSIVARFSNLVVVDTSGTNCFTTGLQ